VQKFRDVLDEVLGDFVDVGREAIGKLTGFVHVEEGQVLVKLGGWKWRAGSEV
jgi:hypothetical protein